MHPALLAATAAVALLLAGPAAATASADFAAGRWAQAAAAATPASPIADLVAGGRAAAVQAAYLTPSKAAARALLLRSDSLLRAALAKSPNDPDVVLHLAITTGYLAKLDRAPALAKQARQGMEFVLARRPADAFALAALGGWHGESVATLGGFLAGTVLGAKRSEFTRLSDRAIAADATSPVYPAFYASTLLALDAGNAARARTLLERATAQRTSDAFEALIQRNARAILAPLAAGNVAEARAVAKRLGPLGTAA